MAKHKNNQMKKSEYRERRENFFKHSPLFANKAERPITKLDHVTVKLNHNSYTYESILKQMQKAFTASTPFSTGYVSTTTSTPINIGTAGTWSSPYFMPNTGHGWTTFPDWVPRDVDDEVPDHDLDPLQLNRRHGGPFRPSEW
jgi:hypothetical protein